MTRYPGQVTTRQVLAGLVLIAGMLVAIVAVIEPLVPEAQIPTPPEVPPEPEVDPEEEPPAPGEVVCLASSSVPPPDQAADVSSSLLIDCPQLYDGHLVAYEGEVIEVVLDRGDRAWVQLNDDAYSDEGPLPEHNTTLGGNGGIAVSIPRATAESIRFHGSYRAQGDRLAVFGVFHAADPADDGTPTIQAVQARVARTGHPIDHPVSPARLAVAAVLTAVALLTAAVTWSQMRIARSAR
jgi:hypothetical protein